MMYLIAVVLFLLPAVVFATGHMAQVSVNGAGWFWCTMLLASLWVAMAVLGIPFITKATKIPDLAFFIPGCVVFIMGLGPCLWSIKN